jgi:hypothetical protein
MDRCIHLVTLSSGDPHPLARKHVLRLRPWIENESDLSYFTVSFLMFGNSFGIMLQRRIYDSQLWVIDWKTGVVRLASNTYLFGARSG